MEGSDFLSDTAVLTLCYLAFSQLIQECGFAMIDVTHYRDYRLKVKISQKN
jgi:hypothetical protein